MAKQERNFKLNMTLTLLVATGVAAVLLSAPATVHAATPTKVTSVEGITEYRLDNGLTVLLFPDASKPTVTVNVTYMVGSRHEGYGETGMAHLLEHLVFKGTPDHPEIWKSLQDHGAQFNGSTSYDRTNYFETLAASDENLEFALKMEADRMVNSFIAKKDLDSEFSVVRNEFEMGENNPLGVLYERVVSSAYLWHNYGKSTIGSREDIERVPIDRLQAFYKKFYQPDNAVLIVTGKYDVDKTLALIGETFGRIPRPTRVLEKTYTVEPVQDGERDVVLRRVGDVQAVMACYHICASAHADSAALQVLEHVLSADKSGRLYKALIDPKLATSVNASAEPGYDPGFFTVSAQLNMQQSLETARKTLLDTVETLATADFTAEEVDRAKAAFAKRFDLLLNESGRVGVMISEFVASGDWRLMFLNRDRVAAVTPADVKRVAAAYFKSSNRTCGTFIPTKSPERTTVPAAPELASLLKGYTGKQALAQGELIEPTPSAIEARLQRSTLSTGAKVVMLPKKSRGEQVQARIVLHYGTEQALAGKVDASQMLPAMLMRGTTKHTRRQLQDEFDKLKAQVNLEGSGGRRRMGQGGGPASPGMIGVNITTMRKNLPATLELVAEILRSPAFPADEFEQYKTETITELEQALSEPMMLAMQEMRRRMMPVPPEDVRYVPTYQERIDRVKAVTVDSIKSVYRSMVGLSNAEIAIVGDFDVSEITNVLENSFSEFKSGAPFARIENTHRDIKAEEVVLNTPDKANAMMTMSLTLPIRDDDADYAALVIVNRMLGEGGSSRIMNRLRQKEGLSYGARTSLQASAWDKYGALVAFAICAPENCEKAVAFAREEFANAVKDGFSQKELDDAKKGYFEEVKVALSNDGAIMQTAATDLYVGRTMKFTQEQHDRIAALTLDQVNATLRKYIDPAKLVVVRAGDFKKNAG